ncbi:cytochrome P450 [Allokutzneria sp. A3M-2-11 16]|uniref:cytochrome P450 n=1 Tax=Allokutzneria sp. A3M-2-11 16 TaxID=2962043 RepID=UPI0020B83345|nr:cytochrome P450 [Allokutzneria sp. A3M-2-11 16]MCP3798432.1 cytochrome P450 [Allokutzneria sp. A3M-2-11 16]
MSVRAAPGRWPLLGHTPSLLLGRFRFTDGLRAHGDVVELYIGPLRTYFLTSPELVHRVLVTEGAGFGKGALLHKLRPYLGNGVAMSDGPLHRRQRRLLLPAFAHGRIEHYARNMVRAATELAGSWQPGEVRDIAADMQRVAVTIVGEALFSTQLGGAAIEEARRSIPVIVKQGTIRALSPSFVERLPLPGNRAFDAAVTRMREVVAKVVAGWDGTDNGDLLSLLLLARDEETGEGMTEREVFDEVITLLSAGIETSALALGWLFHELGNRPEVEARVRDEVDEVVGDRPVTFADLPKLEYTRRVITEVLRMYPIWVLMRRAIRQTDLGGLCVRPGDEVLLSPHALHFDPNSFPDPERFDPDRWSPDRAATVPDGAFIPFGAGIRQCLGNSFAMTEMLIVVASVVARWRLVPVPDRPVRVKFTSVAHPSELPMTATPR